MLRTISLTVVTSLIIIAVIILIFFDGCVSLPERDTSNIKIMKTVYVDAEQVGYQDYWPKHDSKYLITEFVVLYYEYDNATIRTDVNNRETVYIIIDAVLLNKNDEIITETKGLSKIYENRKEKYGLVVVKPEYFRLRPGRYKLRITLNDMYSMSRVVKTAEFTLEAVIAGILLPPYTSIICKSGNKQSFKGS